jgi:lipopolysaccharide transport system ATP-binding protein
MRPLAVRADGIAKLFNLGRTRRQRTFREAVTQSIAGLWPTSRGPAMDAPLLWALDDISFTVERGEVVGIIGRNGAGKSTLLKILSRITEPTRGQIDLFGRVGALLEVGTGFHSELTGRENIFLSGAILGMKRAEVRQKFDAIVAFAEMDRFLDTQVKHYSSGMFTRLAFAVAAHLEPEILIVDEVLAVGDASFQRKCLNKMEDVGKEGRTVLFVSHNMPAVTRLCPRTILLDRGKILKDGPSHEVVSAYLGSGLGTTAAREWDDASAPGDAVVRLRAVRVRGASGVVAAAVDIRKPLGVEIEFSVEEDGHRLVPNLHFYDDQGACAFVSSEVDSSWHRKPRPRGTYRSTAWIPANFLAEGSYIVSAAISTMDPVTVHCHEREAVAFQVIDSFDGDSARGDYGGAIPGIVRPLLRWDTSFEPAEALLKEGRTR